MKLNWKHGAGAFTLSMVIFGIPATAQVTSPAKPVKPVEQAKPPVEEIKQPAQSGEYEVPGKGQILDRGKGVPLPTREAAPPPVDDAAAAIADKGIKDKGVASCGSCGVTGREAAPDTDGPGGGPRTAAPATQDSPPPPPSAEKWEDPKGGQHFIRGKPKPSGARKKGPKERDKPASNTSRSSLLPVLGGVAVLGAVLAMSGGNDNPASP